MGVLQQFVCEFLKRGQGLLLELPDALACQPDDLPDLLEGPWRPFVPVQGESQFEDPPLPLVE